MVGLDIRSVVLMTGIMGLLMAVVFWFLRRNFPLSIKGLEEWAAASSLAPVVSLLLLARGAIPDSLSIVLATLLMYGVMSMYYFGTRRFLGFKPPIRRWLLLILLLAVPVSWFSLVAPHHGVRVAINSSFLGVLAFVHAGLILRHAARNFSSYFAAAALLALGTSMAIRLVFAFGLSADDAVFDNSSAEQTAYILMGFVAHLAGAIGLVLMATDRLRSEVEHMASHDLLTGALMRRALIDACEQELERGRRNSRDMSLLLMDLDHFKTINDTHGHLAGDRVLVDFVARVKALLRRPDHLGRFGGEEFVALLPETSLAEAAVVAERICTGMESADPELPAYTVSIGIAVSGRADTTLDALLARADAALYQAKAAGRNCVRTSG